MKTRKTPQNEIDKALNIKEATMQTNNHQIVDHNKVLDAGFGKPGTSERIAAEEDAFTFI